MSSKIVSGEPFLCVIDELLSKEECRELILKAENMKTDDSGNKSWHNPHTGGTYKRVIMVDRDLADRLFERIKPVLPQTMDNYRLVYLNSHFRFSKYSPGGLFPIHMDGTNYDNDRIQNGNSSVSVCTLNIFLNDKFSGGETEFFYFLDNNDEIELPGPTRYVASPAPGRACLFYAKQYHCGNKVRDGYKYLLRTDVMGIPI